MKMKSHLLERKGWWLVMWRMLKKDIWLQHTKGSMRGVVSTSEENGKNYLLTL